jgi:prepilin-type N-terminal cleavage/methylation domain-containing protein
MRTRTTTPHNPYADPTRPRAFTLVELIVAAVVLASISLVTSTLLVGVLKAQQAATSQNRLDRMTAIAIWRIEEHTREAVAIYIPNNHDTTRGILAVSHRFDDDGDGLFDEDAAGAADANHGVLGFDDDGDTLIDEGDPADDDEDGLIDEDPIDGIDNDGDTLIDEDFGADMDGAGGDDDDADGTTNEDGPSAIVYYIDGTDLMEWHPDHGTNAVAKNVTDFRVTYEPPTTAFGLPAVKIEIDLKAVDGETRTMRTRAVPRNHGLYGQ